MRTDFMFSPPTDGEALSVRVCAEAIPEGGVVSILRGIGGGAFSMRGGGQEH